METDVIIPCKEVRLQGCLRMHPDSTGPKNPGGVVVTHPHPLYGGNMDNPVVTAVGDAFFAAGFSVLRFNFRGTGKSTGIFDNGAGEQEDVRAALAFLGEKGVSPLVLAGYSFGAWVNAHVVASGADIGDHVMVSPPAAFLSFDGIDRLPNTGLILTGAADEIAPPDIIRPLLDRLGIDPLFEVLEGGDHFYSGTLMGLRDLILDYLS